MKTDVCVIGSGPGGAMVASRLAAAGAKVVILEEGGLHTRAEFDMQEATAYPRLYQERGNRATADLSIAILQGRAVGGGTVVNWTTSFRTPDHVLEHWQKTEGSELTPAVLAPHFAEVEQRLNVQKVDLDDTNANNRAVWDGCTKLGWQVDTTRRNVRGCLRTGYCGMGCPVDAKQSAALTYLPDAVARGAVLKPDSRAERIAVRDGRAVAVEGRGFSIEPDVVVLSAGAINSPAVLLRSGILDGPVGRKTWLHPTIAVAALYEQRIEGFYGAPQSVASHHFARRTEGAGFFIEAAPVHPMLAALATPGFGAPMRAQMAAMANVAATIALMIDGFSDDEGGGTVTLRDGLPRLDYPFTDRMYECFRAAMKATCRLHLANGAREIHTSHTRDLRVTSEADLRLIDEAPMGPNLFGVFSAHQMGGCRMGADPGRSVVNPQLRHHAVKNLFVVDGSVFPTALGVNPMESIYGVASWASQHVQKALS
ncbi:MAG TPA: GMC family oxidoreductase [Myxococcales bacterium]|nr:GMC family oxidoreductase [Myxococcales bacterium]